MLISLENGDVRRSPFCMSVHCKDVGWWKMPLLQAVTRLFVASITQMPLVALPSRISCSVIEAHHIHRVFDWTPQISRLGHLLKMHHAS